MTTRVTTVAAALLLAASMVGSSGDASSAPLRFASAAAAPPPRAATATAASAMASNSYDNSITKNSKVSQQKEQQQQQKGRIMMVAAAATPNNKDNTSNTTASAITVTTSATAAGGKGDPDGDGGGANGNQYTPNALVARQGGVCPANGNTHVIYVTTHVGTNIESYDTFGRYLGPMINMSSVPKSVGLQKLRGMVVGPDGLLYVAAARASFSRIFALSPSGLPLPLRPARAADESQLRRRQTSGQNQLPSNPYANAYNTPSSAAAAAASSVGERINANILERQMNSDGDDDDGPNGNDRRHQRVDFEELLADDDDEVAHALGKYLSNEQQQQGAAVGGMGLGLGGGQRVGVAGITSDSKYRYVLPPGTTGGAGTEVLISPASPELAFLTGEQRMAATLPRRYRMRPDCTRSYVYTLARLDADTNPNMNHPYAFFFHPEDGTMFVTNQNSVTVTRYVGPTTTKRQLLDIMAAAAGVLHRTPKLTASLKALLRRLAPVESGDPAEYAGGVSGYAGMPLPPSYTIMHALKLTASSNNMSAAAAAAGQRYASSTFGEGGAAGNSPNYMGRGTSADDDATKKKGLEGILVGNRRSHLFGEGGLFGNGGSSSSSQQSVHSSLLGGQHQQQNNLDGATLDSSSSSEGNGNGLPTDIPSKAIGVFAAGWCPFYNLLSVRGMAISPRMRYSVTDRMFVHDMEVVRVNTPLLAAAAAAGRSYGNPSSGNGAASNNGYGSTAGVEITGDKRRSLLGSLFGGLGGLIFGASSPSSAASRNNGGVKGGAPQARMTIRRTIDLSTKTIINLRVVLVADVLGNAIHVLHEHTGELMWSYLNVVRQPIQIHFPKSAERTSTSGDYWFYVTCKDGSVYKLHLRKQGGGGPAAAGGGGAGASSVALLIRPNDPMRAVSGFFENAAHNTLYIADRKGRAIHTYSTPDLASQAKELFYTGTFARRLVGQPEHLLYTHVVAQRHVPFCYELGHDGSLRFTALCYAFQLWMLLAAAAVAVLLLSRTRIGRAIARFVYAAVARVLILIGRAIAGARASAMGAPARRRGLQRKGSASDCDMREQH